MNSCIGEGDNQGTSYVSEESNFIGDSNYINPAFVSSVCQEAGMRLIQEQVGSGCFDVNRTDCDFNCTSFFDADTCLARFETLAPSITPVNVSLMPTFMDNTSFLPTMTTITPSSQQPSSINDTSMPTLESATSTPSLAAPANTEMPTKLVLPPSFTATSSPMEDTLPTFQPGTLTVAPSESGSSRRPIPVPSRSGQPTLRPIISIPSLFETELPTSTDRPTTVAPSNTFKPSCDCYGKGKKSKKNMGKNMKDGKGMSMGKGKGGHASYYTDDAAQYKYETYDDDYNVSHDDKYHSKAIYEDNDDNCICSDTEGKGKGGKSNSGKGKGKKGDGSSGDIDFGSHGSTAKDILHYIESNYDP
jgi:hypothetical protein